MHSFPKIFQLGTKYVQDIFNETVEITEKLDGSHFRFCLDENGEIEMWGRQAQIFVDNVDKKFVPVVQWVQSIKDKLEPGTIYYGETLARPKHNVLKYNSVPKNNFCLFGASHKNNTSFMFYEGLKTLADRLGCDVVPIIFQGILDNKVPNSINGIINELLDRESYLGGPKIEGVVIKNLHRSAIITGTAENPGVMTPIMCAKFVSEAFKEKHESNKGEYKESYAEQVANLFERYRTEARWSKAVQHLGENGELELHPKDIGKLMKEINLDILGECKEEIMEELWKLSFKRYGSAFTRGIPEWYKRKLLEDSQ